MTRARMENLKFIDKMKSIRVMRIMALAAFVVLPFMASAQKYQNGVVDKTVAVIGNEVITISQLEEEVQMMNAYGMMSDKNARCEVLEQMMVSKLFLMQARIDSLEINNDMVESELRSRLDNVKTSLGGEDAVEDYFGKPIYKLRQEWRKSLEEQSLIQQMQGNVSSSIPELTPYDVQQYLEQTDKADLPVVPIKYQLSQICIYPDREAANLAVKERLLAIRERIINGEKFTTLARIYSQDPGSARKGGELGMASKSIFWPAFSDAAMSLKPGIVSQIVETPDGFHIIEVLEKKGDMFNARHILMKPEYTSEDRDNAFRVLDSLKTELTNEAVTFELAARFYSEDPATRTNGGQMADPNTGSSYFEIDQLKPQDYAAIKNLEVGQVSEPFESLDNEGRSGNTVYKIVKVDKVLPSHPASFNNDYSLLLGQAKNVKAMAAIDEFINSKIKSTHIIIDPLFKDCVFEREGWETKYRK